MQCNNIRADLSTCNCLINHIQNKGSGYEIFIKRRPVCQDFS